LFTIRELFVEFSQQIDGKSIALFWALDGESGVAIFDR
jgi:hypothetical protein